MNYVDFSRPDSIKKVDAISGFQKSLFILARAYGLKDPKGMVEDVTSSARYELGNGLEKQEASEKAAAETIDSSVNQPEKAEDKGDEPKILDIKDEPINLDDIPF